eukprot:scpid68805/ scgid24636/ EGF-like module-containing mucin-like hormone receptor-like 1; Cell surface glycoprotein F4/80; EGF-like module receptor 1; EMR1 hormone receptor
MKMFTAKLHVQTAIYIGLILAILCMQHSSGNRCLPAGHTNFTTTSFDRRTKTSRYVFSSGTRQSSPRDVISANATGSSVDFDFPPGCLMTFDSISFTSNGSCFYQVLYSSVQSSGRSNSQNIPFSVNSDADPNGQKVLKFVAMSDVSGSTVTFSAMQRLHPGGVHSPCIILVNAAGQPYVSLSAEDWNECSDTYNPPCYHGYSTASGGSHTQHCKNMFGSYECTCKRGYTRDHGICQDEDECRHLPDVCNADGLSNGSVVCANADGSYRCLCAAGFEVNSRSCQDVDECSRGTHRCAPAGHCVNTPGLYVCDCLPGYTGIYCDSYYTDQISTDTLAGASSTEILPTMPNTNNNGHSVTNRTTGVASLAGTVSASRPDGSSPRSTVLVSMVISLSVLVLMLAVAVLFLWRRSRDNALPCQQEDGVESRTRAFKSAFRKSSSTSHNQNSELHGEYEDPNAHPFLSTRSARASLPSVPSCPHISSSVGCCSDHHAMPSMAYALPADNIAASQPLPLVQHGSARHKASTLPSLPHRVTRVKSAPTAVIHPCSDGTCRSQPISSCVSHTCQEYANAHTYSLATQGMQPAQQQQQQQ